jgi:integrase
VLLGTAGLRIGEALGLAGNTTWQENGPVFPSRRGGPMESSSVTSALRLAGLPRIRVHDLRHTAAGMLLEAGAHPKVVHDLLRHSTVVLTLDTYSHVTDTLSSQAADVIDALFAASIGPELPGDAVQPALARAGSRHAPWLRTTAPGPQRRARQ